MTPFHRLPTHVVPQKYFIDYDVIDLLHFRFEGSERIQLLVKEATSTITCHAAELYVFDVSVVIPNAVGESTTWIATRLEQNIAEETITCHFAQPLPVDTIVTLQLSFHGILNDKLRGFYRTEYELDQEKRILAVTQFEACDARRAFVCWDEPAIKAKYEISMVTDRSLTALSNTHCVRTEIRPRKSNAHIRTKTRSADALVEKFWQFAETPIMSSYLVAMVIGEFDQVTDISPEGVVINIYTRPGMATRGTFALKVATQALSFFTKQFGIPYPLKKLDMVAIPDFLGAMENWGLITYMETYLLVDPQLTSHEVKVDACRTICHELSHQWFGNLVTMEWWTGLWLNEGFAQYMEFDATHALFPEWNVWELFVQEILMGSAFVKDAMTTSHPIEVVVGHPSEVDEIFDVISYHKGASIVRMLAEFLGRDVFYRGVHDYLVQFSYQNTKTEDLWKALERASGLQISEMASTWTKQTGYPVVTLIPVEGGGWTLQQERYLTNSDQKKGDTSLWDVPLTFITSKHPEIQRIGIWNAKSKSSGQETTPLMADKIVSDKLSKAIDPSASWIKLNANHTSFYLVNYPREMWKRLQAPVQTLELGVVDRVSLLNTVFELARGGVLPIGEALDFTSAYVEEPEYLCWKEISTKLAHYCELFGEEIFYPKLQAYVRRLFANVFKRLTWEATGEDTVKSNTGDFRAIAIARLGAANDPAIIAEAHNRYAAYVAGGNKAALSADLRLVVFRIHILNVKDENGQIPILIQQMLALHDASDFAEEKEDCIRALGYVAGATGARQVMDWGVANAKSQDIHLLFRSVGARDRAGAQIAWNYVKEHYTELSTKFSGAVLGRILCASITDFYTEEQALDVEAFLKTKDTSAFQRRLDGVLERVRLHAKEYVRDRAALELWLETNHSLQ